MRVRLKILHTTQGYADRFNPHGMGEIIVGFDTGEMSSEYIKDYQVLLQGGVWMDMDEAFKLRRLIPDNYGRWFREPVTEEERARGYVL